MPTTKSKENHVAKTYVTAIIKSDSFVVRTVNIQ